MPTYTYLCEQHGQFEQFSSIAEYQNEVKCPVCSKLSQRDLLADASTVGGGNATPQTVGSIAEKNSSKMSKEQKKELHDKHNAYKYNKPKGKLPKGMSRIERPKKEESKWY